MHTESTEESGPRSATDTPLVIRIACNTKDYLDWHLIKPLQGNYKKRTEQQIEKLCKLIKKRGIRFPSFVSKINDDILAIDTHGRLFAFERLEKEGYTIPHIPIVYIEAKDRKEAKQLLLECDSKYGTVNQAGYEEFIEDLDISAFIDETDMNDFYMGLELPDIFGLERQVVNLDVEDSDFTTHKELIKKPKKCPYCGAEL